MDQDVQITIKDIPHSSAIEEHIKTEVDKLEKVFEHIVSCHILVEQTNKNQAQGNLHNVRIKLCAPSKELIANHNAEENLYLSIRNAFDDMRRQLEEFAEKLSGKRTKNHAIMLHGRIVRVFEQDQFGFILSADDEEYYFNASNLVHAHFDKLKPGMEVQFAESVGTDGLQAHQVKLRKS